MAITDLSFSSKGADSMELTSSCDQAVALAGIAPDAFAACQQEELKTQWHETEV